jgi:predicted DNA-binding protein
MRIRTNFYIEKERKKRFHKACVDAGRPMSDVINELIERWTQDQEQRAGSRRRPSSR